MCGRPAVARPAVDLIPGPAGSVLRTARIARPCCGRPTVARTARRHTSCRRARRRRGVDPRQQRRRERRGRRGARPALRGQLPRQPGHRAGSRRRLPSGVPVLGAAAAPYVAVSADVVVADTESRARELAAGYGPWVRSIRTGEGAIPFPTHEEARATRDGRRRRARAGPARHPADHTRRSVTRTLPRTARSASIVLPSAYRSSGSSACSTSASTSPPQHSRTRSGRSRCLRSSARSRSPSAPRGAGPPRSSPSCARCSAGRGAVAHRRRHLSGCPLRIRSSLAVRSAADTRGNAHSALPPRITGGGGLRHRRHQ